MSSTFEYTSLPPKDHIRILTVLPEHSPDGLIQCMLRHATIDDEYTCLSYTWGEPTTNPDKILLNGTTFPVRSNLNAFLHTACKKYSSRALWVDAICINQNSDTEKSYQVQQMGSIFRHATAVLAWLGTAPETIIFCKSVRENPTKYLSWEEFEAKEPNADPAAWRAEVERDVKEKGLVLASPEYWKRADERYAYVHDLFKRTSIDTDIVIEFEKLEYWTRAWITQELILATQVTLLAGEEELEFALVDDRIRGFDVPHAVARSRYNTDGLAQLLLRFGKKKCWLVRDRVFSLLGVCPEVMMVDYEVGHVEVLLRTLKAMGRMACLCTAALVMKALELEDDDATVNLETLKFEVSVQPVSVEDCWGSPDYNPGGWKTANGSMFSMEKFCQVSFARMYFFLTEDSSAGRWRMWTHRARVLDENKRSDETYMGEEVPGKLEVKRAADVSDEPLYQIQLEMEALLFMLCRADVFFSGTRKIDEHKSVLIRMDE